MRKTASSIIYPLAAFVLMMAGWYAVIEIFKVPSYLLPLPDAVAARIVRDFGFIAYNAWATTGITLGGFLLSIVIGVPMAILIVGSPLIDRAFMPWLILSQTFPKIALAPLIAVWFGLGILPKLLVTFLVAFFPIVISTIVGLRSAEREVLELAQALRATRRQVFWYFRLPLALPNIFAGLKVSVAFAVVGAVIAEWVGASQGLGYLLLTANASLDTTLLFAVLFALLIIGVVLYYAVELLEHAVIPWHSVVRLRDASGSM